MDATALLNTPLSAARELLGTDAPAVKRAFKALAARWHPDACGDPHAGAVFAHIVALRDAALGAPPRVGAGRRVVRAVDGRTVATEPLSIWPSEGYEVWVGRKTISFACDPDGADLALAAKTAWAGLRYADARMRTAFAPLAPPSAPVLDMALVGGGHMLAIPRPAGFVALPDLLAHLGGRMEAVHVAWLGSGLFNLLAWLHWMGVVHGAITPQAVFINPETHGVALLGGWEFVTPLGTRPKALPLSTLHAIPRLEARGEAVDGATDALLVREVLRAALGARTSLRPRGGDIPDAMGALIAAPPAPTARAEYAAWIGALETAWGPRRFRVLDVAEGAIYPV